MCWRSARGSARVLGEGKDRDKDKDKDEYEYEFEEQTTNLNPVRPPGMSRLLLLEARKPDYSLLQLKLESGAESSAAEGAALAADQQWSSRVFGKLSLVAAQAGSLIFHARPPDANGKLACVAH